MPGGRLVSGDDVGPLIAFLTPRGLGTFLIIPQGLRLGKRDLIRSSRSSFCPFKNQFQVFPKIPHQIVGGNTSRLSLVALLHATRPALYLTDTRVSFQPLCGGNHHHLPPLPGIACRGVGPDAHRGRPARPIRGPQAGGWGLRKRGAWSPTARRQMSGERRAGGPNCSRPGGAIGFMCSARRGVAPSRPRDP